MPRHKTVSDEQVLDILLVTITEVGPDALTFALAAKACGLSPATLVQRHGDRSRLVEAVLLRAWDRLQTATELADREEPATPEGAVGLLMRLMSPEDAERNASDGLLLLREDIRNPVLRARGSAWGQTLALALGRRLSTDANKAQELGWEMAAVWQGAHTWWAFRRNGTAEQAIGHMLRVWLASKR
ncbi:TetR/AcrR family transcriptional regulator [Shinella curvata]|uniref:TetR/AcrR family transcriptional regulator n=1 Tax=Shinella curvata TaxID=1817964 RepID=A0ABT8XHQ6_9HYPH|nr:TetR/AcrR family transcriptional regulator [Shinella curvata]MCJ8056120.1 TetR/AcrR family transcriptional regulator [Shinella curvata]MDO6123279.1 TetR/AcrR family transcriptional regulator [Shinella curvata]